MKWCNGIVGHQLVLLPREENLERAKSTSTLGTVSSFSRQVRFSFWSSFLYVGFLGQMTVAVERVE